MYFFAGVCEPVFLGQCVCVCVWVSPGEIYPAHGNPIVYSCQLNWSVYLHILSALFPSEYGGKVLKKENRENEKGDEETREKEREGKESWFFFLRLCLQDWPQRG